MLYFKKQSKKGCELTFILLKIFKNCACKSSHSVLAI